MNHSHKEADVEQHEGTKGVTGVHSSTKPTFGQKLKRHCGRFWWIHLIIFIIVVLVVVLPVIYVAYPNMAQDSINKGTLAILSQSITNPTPDSIELELRSAVLSNSSHHPNLDAFVGSFYLEDADTPFLEFEVPAVKAVNGTEAEVQRRVAITNLDAFSRYTTTNLLSEEYNIYLRGKGGLKLGSLPKTTVNYNQKITTKGFNGLQGLNVTSFHLQTSSGPFNSNANGTVLIPNPTVISLTMGNVTLTMSVDGTVIGNATIADLFLTPGNSTLPLFATVDTTAVVGLLARPEYNCGILPVEIAGNQSMYNGQELTYFSQALQANRMINEMNIRPAIIEAGFGFVVGNDSVCGPA